MPGKFAAKPDNAIPGRLVIKDAVGGISKSEEEILGQHMWGEEVIFVGR